MGSSFKLSKVFIVLGGDANIPMGIQLNHKQTSRSYKLELQTYFDAQYKDAY